MALGEATVASNWHFFEVDTKFVVLAALTELKVLGLVTDKDINAHIKKSGIDTDKPNPVTQ